MKLRFLIIFLFSSWSYIGYSQIVENEYIIEVKDRKLNSLSKDINQVFDNRNDQYKVISEDLNLAWIKTADEDQLIQFLDRNNNVVAFYPNTYTELRSLPDDPQFAAQWDMKNIGLPRLWEVTTGGKNFYGDDIVVAVLDGGFFNDHEDIEENLWSNPGEIPNDGIDNDNNGYIDDYYGLNINTGNDNHTEHPHGLGVAGIVGAKGNNGIGMTGVNWDIKVLTISETLTTAGLIEGYQYVYNLRKKYNETQGAEGAYIVATNYSAGRSNQFGTSPGNSAWCNMYDLLGSVGILSCGATANLKVDVDEVGDMPSTCPSDYFIAVTNTTRQDELYENAGYGRLNIDIAAPGTGGISLDQGNTYSTFGGTSGATPHVAGAIGLLHSIECEEIAKMSITEPELHALKMKDAILSQSDPLPSLKDVTVSGGRLNILNAARVYGSECPDIGIPSDRGGLEIKSISNIGDNNYKIDYLSPDEDDDYEFMILDASGQVIRRGEFTPPPFGIKQLIIEIPEVASGIYFFSIYNIGSISTKSMLIINNR